MDYVIPRAWRTTLNGCWSLILETALTIVFTCSTILRAWFTRWSIILMALVIFEVSSQYTRSSSRAGKTRAAREQMEDPGSSQNSHIVATHVPMPPSKHVPRRSSTLDTLVMRQPINKLYYTAIKMRWHLGLLRDEKFDATFKRSQIYYSFKTVEYTSIIRQRYLSSVKAFWLMVPIARYSSQVPSNINHTIVDYFTSF